MYVTSALYKKLIGAVLCVSEPCTWASGTEGRPSSVEQCTWTAAASSQACQSSWQLSVATWASISSQPWHSIYVSYCNSPPSCNWCCTWLCCDVRPCLSHGAGQYSIITLKKYICVWDVWYQFWHSIQVVQIENQWRIITWQYSEIHIFWDMMLFWRSWDCASWYISIVKPTRCTIFEVIEYHSTRFGRPLHPSSGIQDCTHSIRYMSYGLVDCLLAVN